jgi:hypothetical protein
VSKPDQGIARRVFFQAWCHRCGWKGAESDFKTAASFELARHNMDRHGGSARIGEEQ